MTLAITYCRAHNGMEAPLVTIEVHLSAGLPAFSIVGLPEAAVREARDRVRSAILNSQYDFPQGRLTVNMAPADLPKQGGQFDLAIALGILAASDQLDAKALKDYEWLAELSLSGDLRKGPGALPAAIACQQAGRRLVCNAENAAEAALVTQGNVFSAEHLLQVTRMLRDPNYQLPLPVIDRNANEIPYPNLADVKGQQGAGERWRLPPVEGITCFFLSTRYRKNPASFPPAGNPATTNRAGGRGNRCGAVGSWPATAMEPQALSGAASYRFSRCADWRWRQPEARRGDTRSPRSTLPGRNRGIPQNRAGRTARATGKP